MNFSDWYTDTMDVYRVKDFKDGALTRSERTLVVSGVKCRVYHSGSSGPSMKRQAADISQNNKIACDNGTDVIPGDELIVTRGGVLGHTTERFRGFAGDVHPFYEPYGGIAPQLEHTEITVLQMVRL
jgi:hypothetical protein